ncbi:MAG TPA: 16S rRNA (adenine(1518)-N(6)/adenine(1519)-N(6))-dimethyltransferase RsmA [bacterium]|nr:16S rRNA (adenine(1518)-N(6)/adenine(1519)-N(6))-dimethyltransferase RsmA [bacterium]
MSFAAKKSLGQHFLFNPVTLDKILALAGIGPEDRVLEIGAGPGALTGRIAARAGRLVAVEKDPRFAKALQEKFQGDPKVTIVEGDFLQMNLEKLLGTSSEGALRGRLDPALPAEGATRAPPWKVIANLPYNVATEIIFHLLELSTFFHSFTVMVQKEVADRIVAKPGSKTYGILSVMTQLFSENKIVMRLKPGSFAPPPKVDSAIVRFRISDGCRFPINHLPTFETVVRSAFGQRRKTILNALKGGGFAAEEIAAALKGAGISPQARAEMLPIEKFAALANTLSLV